MEDAIVMEIDIAAAPDLVFEAWTNVKQRMEWWGDDAVYRSTSLTSDLRVGGKWRNEGRNVDGSTFFVQGEYTRIERPTALAFTWDATWTNGLVTNVLIELARIDTGTRVKITHSGFAAAADRAAHNAGWQRAANWLKRYLSK